MKPGEVRAMPGDLRAEVEAILTGWLERHEPFCPNHGRQGGGGCGSNCWPIREALRVLRSPSSPAPETAAQVEVPCPGWPDCEYVENPPGHKHYAAAPAPRPEETRCPKCGGDRARCGLDSIPHCKPCNSAHACRGRASSHLEDGGGREP